MKRVYAICVLGFFLLQACDLSSQEQPPNLLPTAHPFLADYETQVLFPWITQFEYTKLPGWEKDKEVRNTGPFVYQQNFGTHPAVRIWYSPEIVAWLDNGRPADQPIPDGAMIIKEMYQPPAQIYNELADLPYFQQYPESYQPLLGSLMESWTLMIKDSKGNSADGWFWAQVGPNHDFVANKPVGPDNLPYDASYVDDYTHPIYSGFGTGTCIRCHASSEGESTFITRNNIDSNEQSLQFRVDNSWRSSDYLNPASASAPTIVDRINDYTVLPENQRKALFDTWFLPASQRPWTDDNYEDFAEFKESHSPPEDKFDLALEGEKPKLNTTFAKAFEPLSTMTAEPSSTDIAHFSFPSAFADHVYPGPDPQEYITAGNCLGCHGGLGGAPSGVAQFVQTGPSYGEGYNISPFGEWRWSPMGLAGRDPIFHSQIETELIILMKDAGVLNDGPDGKVPDSVRETQQGLVDTCLRCHGAMGLRQKGLDQNPHVQSAGSNDPVQNWITRKDEAILNPHFDLNDFYRTRLLSATDAPFEPQPNQVLPAPPASEHSYEWGNLAREGISCAICHNITPPTTDESKDWTDLVKATYPDWITSEGQLWSEEFLTFLSTNNTGLYNRAEPDLLLGPFDDVRQKPMEHALAIRPEVAPPFQVGLEPAVPFITDSAMCGTCHTINLPNIGAKEDHYPVLTTLEPNPLFQGIPHSIEQATYLEWLNSKFGPGKNNEQGEDFASCQDCHMPNRFALPSDDGKGEHSVIEPLASQIATIQDADYPIADHQLPSEEIEVPTRPDYRRHELVGLNGFMVEMFRQFEPVLGVDKFDPETYATNGPDFAIENMQLSVQTERVATVAVSDVTLNADQLSAMVTVTNKTGHRLPSGVSFRRVWVEFLVKDAEGSILWGSGRTNAAGFIIGADGERLPTEFLEDPNSYQRHYATINSQNQGQI